MTTQNPQPAAAQAPVTTHFGFFISLPAREWFKMEMSRMPAERKVDVAVAYGNECRSYTFDEFLLLLGFTPPAESDAEAARLTVAGVAKGNPQE